MNWRRSGSCWMSWREESDEYARILAAGDRSSGMDIDPFHLAGNVGRFVAGRGPADVTWGVNRRAIWDCLRRAVTDVGPAARHDGAHQSFGARQNGEPGAVWVCRAADVAAAADRNRADNLSNSDKRRNAAAALAVIPVSKACSLLAMGDPVLAVGRDLLLPTTGGRLALHAAYEVSQDMPA